MDFDEAKTVILGILKAEDMATDFDLIDAVGGDEPLYRRVRARLIMEDLVRDKAGVGLIYSGPAVEPEQAASADTQDTPFALSDKAATPLRIFLSYGHDEHAGLAVRIKKDLEARGHEVWFDLERLKVGGDWQHYIEQGLKWVGEHPGRSSIVVLMTPHSMRRPDGYCLNEIARALDLSLHPVPVMVVQVEPPLSIYRIQWLDMRDCVPVGEREERYDAKLNLLIQAIESGKIDFEGGQARLNNLLNPLEFDADIEQHLPRFTGRGWIISEIESWLASDDVSRVFWITGPPGVGKTALSTWLCARTREVAAFHLCRHGDDRKADPRRVVRSLACQLASQLPDFQDRLNGLRDLDELVKESNAQTLFDRLIVQPLHGGFPRPDRRIVLLIDGLDEATKDGRNELAEFLSHEFAKTPDWVRLILTSRPNPEVMHPLQGLEPRVMEADAPENTDDLREFLRRELRPFTGDDALLERAVAEIVDRSEGIFLYAEWVRQEIANGKLSLDRLEEFPRGLGAVYAEFFLRAFPEVTAYKTTYRPVLEIVAAAREPLGLNYLSEILRWSRYDRKEIPEAFGALFRATDGSFRPFHRTVLDWLTEESTAGPYFVIVEDGDERLADQGWAEYQKGLESMSAYFRAHLPHHLAAIGRWDDLVTLLTDLPFLHQAWQRNTDDVKACWVQIEANSKHSLLEAYGSTIRNPDGQPHTIMSVAMLLRSHGHLNEAMALLRWCDDASRESEDLGSLRLAKMRIGHILHDWGDLKGALAAYKQAEQAARETGDEAGLQACLGNQANILSDWGDLNGDIALRKQQERICRELRLMDSLHSCLGGQASVLKDWGDLKGALALHNEEEQICRELGLKDGLQNCLRNQAVILKASGDLAGAMALIREAEEICRELGLKDGLQWCLGGRAACLIDAGRHQEALPLLKQQEAMCLELGDKDKVTSCYANQGLVYSAGGDLDLAMEYHKKEEALCTELGNPQYLARCLGYQASIHSQKGDHDKAMELYQEQERMCRSLAAPQYLVQSLANQAIILSGEMEQPRQALPLAEEAYGLAVKHGYRDMAERIEKLGDRIRRKAEWDDLVSGLGSGPDEE